jgi:ABC-type branched-subunit amino acid transport system substrate-binding protein
MRSNSTRGSLFKIADRIINERRDVYGFMTERCDIVLKSFRKEEKIMKNRILFISLAVVLALSVGLIGCGTEVPTGPEPSSKIVLAASVSDTGVLADIHHLAKKPIVDEWIAVNPTMTVTVGNTAFPVEENFIDDASLLSNMLDNTDTIIDAIHAGTAHILLGPTCTAYLEAQAPKATTGKVIQLTMEGGATSLFTKLAQLKYSFINLSFSNWFQIPVLAKMLAEAGGGVAKTAYIGYQNDDHGLEYSGEAAKYFAKEGITIDGMMPMTSGDTGADAALVSAAKAADSDILCAFAYPEFVFGLHAVAKAQGYNPKAMIIGPGGNFGVYGFDAIMAGADAEGVMCFAVANSETTKGTVGALMSTLETDMGVPNVDYWGHPCYWAALQMLQEAVENVGEVLASGFIIDQDALRDYIRTHKFTTVLGETYYVTPSVALGPTDYSWTAAQLQWPVPSGYAGLLNYKCHTGEIGQWQDGYIQIVGYAGIGTGSDEYALTNYDVTASFVYPKPAWTP